MQVGARHIIADFKDQKAIEELARRTDIITYEIESGNSQVLKSLEKDTVIHPSPETLKIIQDKLLQKSFLNEHQIDVAEFHKVESIEDLKKSINEFGYPVLLKARRDAYDGHGNYKIDSEEKIQKAYDYFNGQTLLVEKFIPFKMEVSVIAGRSSTGEIKTFPPVENIHKENILNITIAPARVDETIIKDAEKLAHKTMQVLQGAGVFGIEMFVTQDDKLLINEIAPRVHNSGHHSLQSSTTSQFEQHLKAILGMPLGDTTLVHPTIMYNILGPKNFEGKYRVDEPKISSTFLKMYGKEISKPQRKLGHINIVAEEGKEIDDLLKTLENIKKFEFIKSAN